LYDHYTRTVDAAVDLLKPGVVRLTREPPPSVPFQDRAQALAWVDAERRNLVAAVVAAADQGPLPAAWHLADAMRGYFWLGQALAIRRRLGQPLNEAGALLNLAFVHYPSGQLAAAAGYAAQAVELYESTGSRQGLGVALCSLGGARLSLGQPEEAHRLLGRALALSREAGDRNSEAEALP